jgi:hypothetical protein
MPEFVDLAPIAPMKKIFPQLQQSLRSFAGLDLPPREIAIKFQVPLPVAREKAPRLRDIMFLKKDLDDPDADLNYCRALQKNLRQLNRCKIGAVRRFIYNETFITTFYPLILKRVRNHLDDGGIPDPAPRQEMLDLMIDLIRQLIESYKIIFRAIYCGKNFQFARLSSQFDKSAWRILELIKIKQRIMGLRYAALSPQMWLGANIVFHIMHGLGKTETERTTLEGIAANYGEPVQATLCDLFLSLQMVQRFNLSRWPTEWQFSFDRFERSVRDLVQLVPDDGGKLSHNASLSYCYDNRPAHHERAEGRGSALMIYWQRLNKKIMADYLQFFHEKGSGRRGNMAQKFEFLSFTEGLALVQLQLDGLRDQTPVLGHEDLDGQLCDLRIFVGFKYAYPFLYNLHYHADLEQVGTRLEDLLAKRSAILAEDHVSTTDSGWYLQYQDQNILKLRTQETQYTTPLRIGALLIYGIGNEGIQQPSLGMVTRIVRPSAKKVYIDIVRLGAQPEPIMVTVDLDNFQKFDPHGKQVMYGMVVTDAKNVSSLIFPCHCNFIEKDTLVIKRVKGLQMVVLGKLQSVTKSYLSYQFTVSKQDF